MTDSGIPVSHCTGCAACVNICPIDAIQMKERKDGFTYPVVDEEKCVHCGRCTEVCRKWETCLAEAADEPAVYAMLSKNDGLRLHSTSGGIFSETWRQGCGGGLQTGLVCGASDDRKPG